MCLLRTGSASKASPNSFNPVLFCAIGVSENSHKGRKPSNNKDSRVFRFSLVVMLPATTEDPRAMEQRYLCGTVFKQMLGKSLDGVDRDQLRKAVAAGLKNQDGRSRGTIGGIYQQLSHEEIKPLLPAGLGGVHRR